MVIPWEPGSSNRMDPRTSVFQRTLGLTLLVAGTLVSTVTSSSPAAGKLIPYIFIYILLLKVFRVYCVLCPVAWLMRQCSQVGGFSWVCFVVPLHMLSSVSAASAQSIDST